MHPHLEAAPRQNMVGYGTSAEEQDQRHPYLPIFYATPSETMELQQNAEDARLGLHESILDTGIVSETLQRSLTAALSGLPLANRSGKGQVPLLNRPGLKDQRDIGPLSEDERTSLLSFLTAKNAQAMAKY